MALFKRKSAAQAPVQTNPLVMCEIFADAPPDLASFKGETSALKDKLIAEEGVHPFAPASQAEKYAEIDRCRLAPARAGADGKVWNKHCYGLFDEVSGKLLAAVYVHLYHLAADAKGKVADKHLVGNVHESLASAGTWIEAPNTAFFYTITSMRDKTQGAVKAGEAEAMSAKALAKLKKAADKQLGKALGKAVKTNNVILDITNLGELTPPQRTNAEQLIHFAAAEVSKQFGIANHSTLSPVRTWNKRDNSMAGLRPWLKEVLSNDVKAKKLLTNDEQALLNQAQGANYFEKLEYFHQQRTNSQTTVPPAFTRLMEDLAIYYIVHEHDPKKPNRPRDSVTGFHIPNGAKLANVHYLPPEQSTKLEDEGSFGMIANYLYELELLAARKANFKREAIVPLGLELSQRYQARLSALGEKTDVGSPHTRARVEPHDSHPNEHRLPLGQINPHSADHVGKVVLVRAERVAESGPSGR